MKYIAAILSVFIHVLIVFLLCKNIFIIPEIVVSRFDIELVRTSVPEKKNSELKLKKTISPKIERVKKNEHKIVRKKRLSPKQKAGSSGSVKPISVKSVAKVKKAISAVSAPPVIESKSIHNKNAIVLKQGKSLTIGNNTVVIKRGSEGRTFDNLAAYSFNEDDFSGHYETETGRAVVVIDARQDHGRLVLHDQKTGLTRKLRKAGLGDFIYTYGPSFNEDFPVEGSVVFLPGDEHWIRRFMWLPGNESAEYPRKGRVREVRESEEVKVNNLFIPESKGVFPAIILARFGAVIPDDQFSEVARHLSGRGVVVQVVSPLKELTEEDLTQLADKMRHMKKVDPEHVGIWIRGYKPQSVPLMPKSLQMFDFALLTIDSPAGSFYPERITSIIPENIPMFIGFSNVSNKWKKMISIMPTGLQSVPHQLEVLDKASTVIEAGTDLESLDSLSGDFVSSISAWLVSH
ncbi:MAG: hypothetical protein JEY82_02575 [Maridesulfovibrio ferrireducens]|nr:hypothetical protein [Maridesulfovibrio ferrireducens]